MDDTLSISTSLLALLGADFSLALNDFVEKSSLVFAFYKRFFKSFDYWVPKSGVLSKTLRDYELSDFSGLWILKIGLDELDGEKSSN